MEANCTAEKDTHWFGYQSQKRVIDQIICNAAVKSQVILLFGPPRNGKSSLAQYCHTRAPKARFVCIRCNVEASGGTLASSYIYVQNLIRNLPARSGIRLILFLDEIDTVAVRRDRSTINSTQDLQKLLGVIDTAMETPGICLLLCTNCPDILDTALTSRCSEVLYISYPASDVIQEALKYMGYTRQISREIADRWIYLMSERGWWSGHQIVSIILSYGYNVQGLSAEQVADQLDELIQGLRTTTTDLMQYELVNSSAIEASRRTLSMLKHENGPNKSHIRQQFQRCAI